MVSLVALLHLYSRLRPPYDVCMQGLHVEESQRMEEWQISAQTVRVEVLKDVPHAGMCVCVCLSVYTTPTP